jgi:hypothetical protein
MTPRKTLRGVALGLLGFFVSRNNDVGGYWGMGKLYALARAAHDMSARIDVLTGQTTPEHAEFNELAAQLQMRLRNHMDALGLPHDRLSRAAVTVRFGTDPNTAIRFETAPHGDPFTCAVELVDDLGVAYVESTGGRCLPHLPERESRSARIEVTSR